MDVMNVCEDQDAADSVLSQQLPGVLEEEKCWHLESQVVMMN